MQENALFVHAFGYMFELTVTGWVHYSYIAIPNWFKLTICFLAFRCDPYFRSQIQILYISPLFTFYRILAIASSYRNTV